MPTCLQNLSGGVKQGQIVGIFSVFQRKNVKYDLTAERVYFLPLNTRRALFLKPSFLFIGLF